MNGSVFLWPACIFATYSFVGCAVGMQTWDVTSMATSDAGEAAAVPTAAQTSYPDPPDPFTPPAPSPTSTTHVVASHR